MREKFTEVDFGLSLLSSMYHQDWRNFGDAAAILDMFLWDEQSLPAVWALQQDVLALSALSIPQIENLWTTLTNGTFLFGQDAASGEKWLGLIQERCRSWYAGHGVTAPTVEIELFDSQLAEMVATEISLLSARRDINPNLAEALAVLRICSRERSPNLALRLLVRIIDSKRLMIDLRLYNELVMFGYSLNCGEFIVACLEYLVAEVNE